MTPGLRLIPAQEYRRERWRNGLGWTREIVREAIDPGADDWVWRLSIADIESDADFSAFPGVDRELVLLHGQGLRLRFDDGETIALEPPYGKHRFAGERALRGELVDGPTRDFNLMWRRDRIEADLWRRPLVGSMILFAEPGAVWAVYLLSGRAQAVCADTRIGLDPGDTAILCADATRQRCQLDGGGEALLIRLHPISNRITESA